MIYLIFLKERFYSSVCLHNGRHIYIFPHHNLCFINLEVADKREQENETMCVDRLSSQVVTDELFHEP